MSWQKIVLSYPQTAQGAGQQLMDELESIFRAAFFPKNAAVFSRLELGQKNSSYFFNPGACQICATLLQRWGGTVCENPGPGVALLIGNQSAFDEQNNP